MENVKLNSMMNILIVENLTKLYPYNNKGIKNINLSIPKNSITILKGPNGSGKTTLLKTIAGILKAEEGKIICNNTNIINNYRKSVEHIAILTNTRNIYWRLTLKENIEFLSGLQGIEDVKSFKEALKYIEMFNISEYINEQIRFLSAGNKEKAAIICTIARMTPILLFDEIATNLDKNSTHELKEILKDLKKNRTIILSSHNENLDDIADHIIQMENGKIRGCK